MPPLPELLWKAASPELRAAVLALVQSYEERLALLENRLGDLENRLKLNSTHSSKPPSSDPIGMKRRPPAPPTGKRTSHSYPRVREKMLVLW
jgi:transposase